MQIQINNRQITVYAKGIPVSSTIEITPEIEDLIIDLEDYIQTQKSPEFIAIEEAQAQKEMARQQADAANAIRIELEATLENIVNNTEAWAVGVSYEVDKMLAYEGRLYVVRQAHISEDGWRPSDLPALYRDITVRVDEPQEWVQPTGEHDAYMEGDVVIFNGEQYQSTINHNVWSPVAYPQGWQKI